jgi:hypothetical protein
MTPEQQRIAIAEACGWSKKTCTLHNKAWHTPKGVCTNIANYTVLPCYLNDLNTMHEAEKLLSQKQRFLFLANLSKICGFDREFRFFEGTRATNDFANFCWALSHATAVQRAEAFRITFGIWKTPERKSDLS